MVKGLKYIVTLVLLSMLLSVQVCAEDIYTEGYLEYHLRDNIISICGYFGNESEVTVPASIAGYPVSEIGAGAFADAGTVTKVNLPDTIMRIEKGAFAGGQTVIYDSNTSDPTFDAPNDVEMPDDNNTNDMEMLDNDNKNSDGNNSGSKSNADSDNSEKKTEDENETGIEDSDNLAAEKKVSDGKNAAENSKEHVEKAAGDEETEAVLEEIQEQKNNVDHSLKVWIILGALVMLIAVSAVIGVRHKK